MNMCQSKFEIEVNRKFANLTAFVKDLPNLFSDQGNTIYTGRNVLKTYEVEGVNLVVKSFKVPIFINKIAYSYFRDSKAKRSYLHACELIKRGIDTPAPVAFINEFKCGLLYRSYYICIFENEAQTIAPYVFGEIEDDSVLKDLAFYIAKLHRLGVYHLDLSPGNILYRQQDGKNIFSIIDINRLRFEPVDKANGLLNFARIAKSLAVSTSLARYYAEAMGYDQDEAVRNINAVSDKFFKAKTFSFARKEVKRKYGLFYSLFGPVQLFKLTHTLRILLPKGKFKNQLFRKEKELYVNYIQFSDLRKVWQREYE